MYILCLFDLLNKWCFFKYHFWRGKEMFFKVRIWKKRCTKIFLLPSMCAMHWKVLLGRMCILCLLDLLKKCYFFKSCFLRKKVMFLEVVILKISGTKLFMFKIVRKMYLKVRLYRNVHTLLSWFNKQM